MLRAGVLFLLAVLTAACARTPPIGADGGRFMPAPGERDVWASAEREEAQLLQRVKVYEEPALTEYLMRLADAIVPERVQRAGGPPLVFTIVSDPAVYAFAMPNGRVFVSMGLLARVANEAQLAMVIAHEVMHVVHRDALEYARRAPYREVLELLPGVATAVEIASTPGATKLPSRPTAPVGMASLSPTANAIIGLGLKMTAVAAMAGYGRELERRADDEGLTRVLNAGYDANEAWQAFAWLAADAGERGAMEMFALGTPPGLKDRTDNTRWLVVNHHPIEAAFTDAIRDTPEFSERTRAVVRENAVLDVRAGRFVLAQKQLDRVLRLAPDDAVAHVYQGDLHRLQAQRLRPSAERTVLVGKALASYERAVEIAPAYAEPFRQLGLLHYQEREPARAREAFTRYLALAPNAPDAARVRDYLAELGR